MTLLLQVPDADLGDALAAGAHGPVPRDLAAFEASFMALVEAAGPDPTSAWDAFYDRTLSRVAEGWGREVPGSGTVATFTRIWSRAASLSRGGTVLDVGSCFAFLALAWAARPGAPVLLAVDLAHASAALAARQSRRLGAGVAVVQADGKRLPLPDRGADTVLLLHVLEHLEPDCADHVLAEALRVARHRVVVAVPVEPAPDPLFGHVQVYDLPRLAAVGLATGWACSMSDADGAWLVLDRP